MNDELRKRFIEQECANCDEITSCDIETELECENKWLEKELQQLKDNKKDSLKDNKFCKRKYPDCGSPSACDMCYELQQYADFCLKLKEKYNIK